MKTPRIHASKIIKPQGLNTGWKRPNTGWIKENNDPCLKESNTWGIGASFRGN